MAGGAPHPHPLPTGGRGGALVAGRDLPPRRVPLQHLLPPQGELVDGIGDLAQIPWQRLADGGGAVLFHQHQREPARAEFQADFAAGVRVRVDDQQGIAFGEGRRITRQKLHLADEVGVIRAVGKDDDRAVDIQEVRQNHIPGLNRPFGRCNCFGHRRQWHERQDKGADQGLHRASGFLASYR
jgi:hypothetical protein